MVSCIRAICKENGTTITGLARELGWPRGTIDRWDENKPSIDKVLRVADKYQISLDYICGRSKQKKIAVDYSDLSDDERLIIDLFRNAPQDKKNLAISLIKTVSESPAVPSATNESSQ